MDILDEYMGSNMSHACPNRRALDNGYQVGDINMVGIRSYEDGEVKFYHEHPELNVITADMFRELGYQKVVEKIKNRYDSNAVFYLSFDIDAIDPSYAPGTGTPETFGLTPLQMREFLTLAFKNLRTSFFLTSPFSPFSLMNFLASFLETFPSVVLSSPSLKAFNSSASITPFPSLSTLLKIDFSSLV